MIGSKVITSFSGHMSKCCFYKPFKSVVVLLQCIMLLHPCLEFSKCFLNWVKIKGIRRQKFQQDTSFLTHFLQTLIISSIAGDISTSEWWIGALSIMIIDLGSGKGLQCGRTLVSKNSSNVAAVNDLCLTSHVINPCMVYAGRIDQRSERWKDLISCGVMPIGAHPYFLCAVLSFAVDSSMNTSWSVV